MIACQALSFGYTSRQPLFSDLSLELDQGHIHGVFGANGSGKSTLLKLVCGLLEPQQGSATLWGKKAFERRPSVLRDVIFLPEEFKVPPMTLQEYGKRYGAFYPRFSSDMLHQYAVEFGIEMNIRLDRASMGQRKKGMICFGLACCPTVLLMDEPTNGLDIPSKAIFRRLIASFADEERCVVISTHQVRDLEQLIDNVILLDEQGVVFNYPLDAISQKLSFRPLKSGERALYQEEDVRGIKGIVTNNGTEESEVDLEMLFMAMSQPKLRDTLAHILNKA